MRYIDFSEISQELKDEIISQCFTHDFIVDKIKERILSLLDRLEKSNPICDCCFMDYYHWLFRLYKLLCQIMYHSVDLISQKSLENDDLRKFLNDVEFRFCSVLEKVK